MTGPLVTVPRYPTTAMFEAARSIATQDMIHAAWSQMIAAWEKQPDVPRISTSTAEEFLKLMERRLDIAEGKTFETAAMMQCAAAEFALNGRRLIAMIRGAVKTEAIPMCWKYRGRRCLVFCQLHLPGDACSNDQAPYEA